MLVYNTITIFALHDPLLNRDYITYMLSLVVFYLLFPAYTMMSSYDAINKHFRKIHHQKVC